MTFVVVYIREAHPTDGWEFQNNVKVQDPKNFKKRTEVARQCVETLKLKTLTVVDDMKDSVNQAYTAMPERLALVGKDGKIAYMAGQGPWGFKPSDLEKAIQVHLKDTKNHRKK